MRLNGRSKTKTKYNNYPFQGIADLLVFAAFIVA